MQHHTLFSDKSDLYERARPGYPREVFSYLSGLSSETQLAWDCACGNGQAAIGLAQEFELVLATDVSAEQISNAKKHPQVRYKIGAAETTDFEDGCFDLVCVAQALHWFEYGKFWPEVKRVLKPGGVFSAFGYNLPSINPAVDDLVRKQILDIIEPYWAPQNQLIWNRYSDIEFPFRRLEAPKFEMTVSWNLQQLFALIHTFSATRRCMDDIGDTFFKQAYLNATNIWPEVDDKKTISFDFVFYAGVNQA